MTILAFKKQPVIGLFFSDYFLFAFLIKYSSPAKIDIKPNNIAAKYTRSRKLSKLNMPITSDAIVKNIEP
ncbi:MAG: hypothetical protein A3J07_01105 [Candidatus Doudnabacteria bacterium RIFCSPLOWO2_02_FULL_49_13]|uniref:Uncharacterized protein n=1 Tax=Candidatus Doudnabacteria bacterium RIFCSPHIGHO2_12_FULL_48_16 TaxID=1817838 RepID=A0A1F5PKE9_9BACT|nr:MAG: hypothetical protein A3B77_04035 [Candidatus Doudnabacteria bacterium RIFCSPHIGHO2_02_FULL_49_24]OGE88654.1 MAG: hypothetical protein A2760_01695 [Candidatus Doudnabacteria bacterium RIFCSPHIGHO2_01_FULL_50_67]OGE90339.1 MAG: hypothetical protein A3E29_04615 [Candidatus Doudnabacteria bacterium RIFCSPHIGHO2_12_FULL_48_16]OGE97046.1 MAG: hypothetical protein A2990_01605 [Candidatus Doudnabacteria bacterium RIFCSPLOWO2_01_FULL_49_40]OGF02395.1 MAG: hypothetical protein A3J07_01105 [Candid